jgi:catechol 2,3-dioxygenase-like lactoylglutathione lyase family enzyme
LRLKQILLFVKDLAAVESFYTNTLGLHPIEQSRAPGWLEFAEGLALHAIPEQIANEIVISSPPEVREETPLKPIFQTDDFDSSCARLEAAGVPVKRYDWGAADCVDPEGNVFQICR